MEVHRSQQFANWIAKLVERAKANEPHARTMARHVLDQLHHLKDLEAEPAEDSATLKRVRQSRNYPVWRLAHPYDPDLAVRIICWFDPNSHIVVVALFAADKATMGEAFYNSVGSRADQEIDKWSRENEENR